MALTSLATILPRWVQWADRMRPLFEGASYPLSESRPKFVGEIIQKFNVRKGKATLGAEYSINSIKTSVRDILIPALKQANMTFTEEEYLDAEILENFCIAEIPDFQGMIHKSYSIGKPVFALTDAEIRNSFNDGQNQTVGSLFTNYVKMRDKYKLDFEQIANQIIKIGQYANSTQSVFA
jgi:chromosome partitioning protein